MAQPKPWLKMWIEWLHDPKMLGLTLAEAGAWWKLVTLAQQCAADGQLVKGNGSPLSLPEIANSLHISTPRDMKTLQSMIEKMEAAGSLIWSSHVLIIVHFAERQELAASTTKEAVRERVKQHREKLKKEADLKTPLTTPLLEKEGEGEGTSVTFPLQGNEKVVTAEAALAEITNLHEKNFGIITPFLSEKFKDFVENYRGPVEWIKEAFAEAVKYKNRRWQYVEAILYSWQEKGGPHADRREPGDGGRRPGADRGDPLESYRKGGWEVVGEGEPEATEAGNKD